MMVKKRPKDWKRRRDSALIETQRSLSKEMSYPKDLRNQNYIDRLNKHIKRLMKMK